MTDVPLEAYLATVRPDAHATVRALVRAIEAAGSDFDCAIKYGILLYTFDRRWHDWVTGVSVTSKFVSLRFLYRDHVSDPTCPLRPGSTTAGAIDYRSADEVDAGRVTAWVKEAAARHGRSGLRD
jgi:hypothetical protein